MNTKYYIIFFVLLIVVGVVIYPLLNTEKIKNITPQEAKINLEKDSDIILLDVRTLEEYQDKNISGSILIPLNTLKNTVENEITNKETTIYVYCRSGNRSASAVKILDKLGYKNAHNLGGILDWPYETN